MSSREMGAVFERKIAKLFRENTPWTDAERGLQMGQDCRVPVPDIVIPMLWPECKHYSRRKWSPTIPSKALAQARRDRDKAGSDKLCCAITKVKDERQIWVWMTASDYADLAIDGDVVQRMPDIIVSMRLEDLFEIVKAGAG